MLPSTDGGNDYQKGRIIFQQKKYEVIKSLADHPAPNKQRAAPLLSVVLYVTLTVFKGYERTCLFYPNRGRKPANNPQ